MIHITCKVCKLAWTEDRAIDDEPIRDGAMTCPRCGTVSEPDDRKHVAQPRETKGES